MLLLTDRDLHADGVRAEAVAHRLDGVEEVGAGAVHLVDEGDARDVVLVGLAPDGLRLRLDTDSLFWTLEEISDGLAN